MRLSNGFEVEIDKEKLDDWETLEVIDELDEHPERTVRLAKKLLGDDDYQKLKEHCRVDGKVSMSGMMDAIGEILNGDDTKNS